MLRDFGRLPCPPSLRLCKTMRVSTRFRNGHISSGCRADAPTHGGRRRRGIRSGAFLAAGWSDNRLQRASLARIRESVRALEIGIREEVTP